MHLRAEFAKHSPAQRIGCVALLVAAFFAATVQATESTTPVPYTAVYSTSLNGMPLGIDLRMTLAAAENNAWLMSLNAGSMMMRYTESSLFHWVDCRAEPIRYRFEFKGFGVDRKLWLDFDHNRNSASGESRRGPISFAFPADVTDELGLSYGARCQLERGATQVTYNVATTNGMKALTYLIDGRDLLKTPLGKVETIRIVRARDKNEKRRSTIWVAPSLGYIMVKMEHVEKLGVRGSAILKSLEGITPVPATAGTGR